MKAYKIVDSEGYTYQATKATLLLLLQEQYGAVSAIAPVTGRVKMTPQYLLSKIPNDDEGKSFITQLKKYLNKDGWELRVRGQHLKKGLDWRRYERGQPIDCSTHLRLYVKRK